MPHGWPQESLDIWMQNAGADLHWHGDLSIPITHAYPARLPDTSYITSLRSGWFDYAAQELGDQKLAASGVRLAGQVARCMGFDRLILVGNFPVSTNAWPLDTHHALTEACLDTVRAHATHFVGIRNLQKEKNASVMHALRTQGFHALPARVVYEFDLREGLKSKPSHLMRDRSALAKSNLAIHIKSEISNVQASRMRELYQAIYIQKHSVLNAQYTTQFFADMVQSQLMQALVLENREGTIMAFAMLYRQGDTLTVPALGYDTEADIDGLYRLLFAAIHQYTQTQQLLLNYSSGAGDFKRKRGGLPRMEYTLLRAPFQWQRRLLSWIESKTAPLQVDQLIKLGA